MPRYSGFQLCQTFATFSSTQLIPIVVVSGEAGSRTKELCRDLGAAAYFEKPIDFRFVAREARGIIAGAPKGTQIGSAGSIEDSGSADRRRPSGGRFDVITRTENVGRGSFLCACGAEMNDGSFTDVSLRLVDGQDDYIGKAEIIRSEYNDTHYPRYGCRFKEKPEHWVLQ